MTNSYQTVVLFIVICFYHVLTNLIVLKLLLMVFRTWYNVKILAFWNNNKTVRTDYLSFHDFRQCVLFQLKNENPMLSKTENQQIYMCEHSAYEVNVFRKGLLCAPDYSETPCRLSVLVPDQKRIHQRTKHEKAKWHRTMYLTGPFMGKFFCL